jgi:hypothetical protein
VAVVLRDALRAAFGERKAITGMTGMTGMETGRFARNDDGAVGRSNQSAYTRGRRHPGSLAAPASARSAGGTRLQTVNTNANRLHCQSGPIAAPGNGSEKVSPAATRATTQASETKART